MHIAGYAQISMKHVIRLRSGDITIPENAPTLLSGAFAKQATPSQVILQFDTPFSQSQKEQLERQGIQLIDYLPTNAYVAIIPARLSAAAFRDIPLWGILPVDATWKLPTSATNALAKGNVSQQLLVSTINNNGLEVKELVEALGGKLLISGMEPYGYYRITIPSNQIENLAGWYAVRGISPWSDMVPLDRETIANVDGYKAISSPIWGGHGLSGAGVTVGVGDNTSGIFHTDVRDRILNFNPAPMTNHGIHINVITGGAAILDPRAVSVAPDVQLLDFFFSMVLSATGAMYQDHNMTLTNNSYTVIEGDCNYFGTYDLYSRFLDTISVQYPLVQHVFAAGNDGELNCNPFPDGYGTMGGGYQPSKNNIVVGSISRTFEQANDQSRGPVRDGRIKPDIVALGVNVYSGLRNNTYGEASGTSMASPQAVSGLVVLTQRYKELNSGTQPTANLLKTILIAGATEMGIPGPDFSYGFGLMDVGNSLNILDSSKYFTGDVTNGDSTSYTFTVPTGNAKLKITLCWTDVPASTLSATQLVNDLDLRVVGPDGSRHLPLVPDGSLAHITEQAIEQEDHINNVEQITIDAPTAGTYTINVKGHTVITAMQSFSVAYRTESKNAQLTFPLGGEQWPNTDSVRVCWNTPADGSNFLLEMSPDNGTSWYEVKNDIPASSRYYSFLPGGINSGKCLIRLTNNTTGHSTSSGRFAITSKPVVVAADHQCPGYLNVHWSPIPNAANYVILKKEGPKMVAIDTVADTSYSYIGLVQNDWAFVAVQPLTDGMLGCRSNALKAMPNTGDCTDPSSNGDLSVESVLSPVSGREFTTNDPGASNSAKVKLRNLYNVVNTAYTLSYQLDGGIWHSITSPAPIPANNTVVFNIPGLDFSSLGTHRLKLAITNNALTDPYNGNDTLDYTFRRIANPPISLSSPIEDGFEDIPLLSIHQDSIGISPNNYWDFITADDSGRLRSYVYNDVLISGNRSISLDQMQPMTHGSNNMLSGNFNLSAFDTATTEIRMDIDYVLHGTPTSSNGNHVYVRANDGLPFSSSLDYDLSAYPGYLQQIRSFSLTDAVRWTGGNFSASTQIAFGQNDTSLIAAGNYGNGMTFDNFRMYTVTNDAVMYRVVSPQPANCGLPSELPLTITVRNGVNQTLHNVQLFYSMDSGAIHSGVIDSIRGKDSVHYTFAEMLSIGSRADHSITVWLQESGDSYTQNDTILNYHFINSKIITEYPYLENFEASDGGYYASGFLSSWAYGIPASNSISMAASGTHAWKTNLNGHYNELERSYLYSPCFDISGLTHPMLSFSMAEDIENCGSILCDGAYIEYSFDGSDWQKLGSAGYGTNWYDSAFNIWNENGFTRWHVASIPLPASGSGGILHLRFAFFADPAVNFDGVAIDDIHIYDLGYPIATTSDSLTVYANTTAKLLSTWINGNGTVGEIIAGASMNNAGITLYKQTNLSNSGATQYLAPRSYRLKLPTTTTFDTLHLFITDSEIVQIANDQSCPSCTPLPDVYRMGITHYNGVAENGQLSDNTDGTTLYVPYGNICWIPYDKGYRADLQSLGNGEYWLNNGGPTHTFPANTDYLNFVAFLDKEQHATTYWYSLIDTAVNSYIVERSINNIDYVDMASISPAHSVPGSYAKTDTVIIGNNDTLYYRLKYQLQNNSKLYYSPVRRVTINDTPANLIRLSAQMVSSQSVSIKWVSYIDALASSYVLERAIENGNYQVIDAPNSLGNYGQEYTNIDAPNRVPHGSELKYRLTARLRDGSDITLPIQLVRWIDGSEVAAIYPNPVTNNQFTIVWNADSGTRINMKLTDATGRKILTGSDVANAWTNTTHITTERLTPGVYFLQLTIGSFTHTVRLLYE